MNETTLSIFVDESGNLSCTKDSSRFYIVSLVLHDQSNPIDGQVHELDTAFSAMGLPSLCFHAGPLIRREDGYQYMSWELRSRIFAKMMAFARRTPFRYRCLCVDKRFTATEERVATKVRAGLLALFSELPPVSGGGRIKIYYDCGQAALTNLIHAAMTDKFGDGWDFAQGVKPSRYRLFQLADLVCTVALLESKLAEGLPLTKSEDTFFGGPRNFRRNILKQLKRKRI